LAEHKTDETFKVVDRRLFDESGQFRREVAEQQERERERPATPNSKIAPPNAPTPSAQPGRTANAAPAAGTQTGTGAAAVAPAAAPNRAFQMLVDFIARNAAMLLGGYQDPHTGQALLDLDGAREIIDMLDALRETTRGNLAAEDERILLDVIGSLKLTFMEVSKAAAAAMKEKAKAPR
jgi:Domain of unknown function (DUF1844)